MENLQIQVIQREDNDDDDDDDDDHVERSVADWLLIRRMSPG